MQIEGVEVKTLAGSDVAGSSDVPPPTFSNPANLVVGPAGKIYVSDFDNGRLRTVETSGAVGTLTDQAGFARPFGLVVTDDQKLIVQTDFNDQGGNGGTSAGVLWLVDPASGVATVLVTDVGKPRGLARLPNGTIAMTDVERHDIRIFDPATSSITSLAGMNGDSGFKDGAGEEARFDRPYGAVATPDGDVLVADQNNHVIRKITSSGVVSTFAGVGEGMVDGPLSEARFNMPQDLAIDSAGNVYVTDVGNHRIRRISTSGIVETVAGDGTLGFRDGTGGEARFFGQEGIDVEPDGSVLYVADGTNGEVEPYHRVRTIMLP
jgi:sugar lactone lactonase YvrE